MSEQDVRSGPANMPVYYSSTDTCSIPNRSLILLCRDILAKGNSFRFSAPGFSMTPFIRDRDIITLTSIPKESCTIGKVVGFVRPGTSQFVVHRIVAVKENGFLIRGDNCCEDDGIIPFDAILGEVCQVEHNGRNFPIGLGIERIIIAILSRMGFLRYLSYPVGFLVSRIKNIS